MLAARLSENASRRVALIEAGPDYGHHASGRWPASLLDGRADGALAALQTGETETHDWGFDAGRSASRARVIGGCSSHNGCEVLWGSPADYDEWANLTGNSGWSYRELLPYLRRADQTIGTRPSQRAQLSPIRRALLSAASELGMVELADLNAPDALRGSGGIPVNARGTRRWGAAFAYLDPARPRPNLTIIADTLVDRVVLERGRAIGALVRRSGREYRLTADVVVLTAGSLRHARSPRPQRDRPRRDAGRPWNPSGGERRRASAVTCSTTRMC